MDDLLVPPGPGAPRGLVIPAWELSERFSHSSGPGGQSVNTTDSKVQLSWEISTTSALSDIQRSRALERLDSKLADGVLTVSASQERSQFRNRKLARERLAAIIREALVPVVPRRATKPTKASIRRRLDAKKRRASLKQNRQRPAAE